jgi:hypothetical protein
MEKALETGKNPYAAAAYDLAQRYEAKKVLNAFAEQQIPVVALKGVVFKQTIYDDSERRPMYDIDVLVRREDIHRAGKVLEHLGYVFLSDGDYNFEFTRDFMGEIPYKKGSVVIELHWHLVSMSWNRRACHFDLDEMWERAVRIEIMGVPALRLDREDEIIYMCYHLAVPHSLWHKSGIQDIQRLLRAAQDIDWRAISSRAKRWHVGVACWAALKKVQNVTGLLLPNGVPDNFNVPAWRQKLLNRFVDVEDENQTALVSGRMRFLGILLVDNFWTLPGVLLGGLFPGRQWLKSRYSLTDRSAFWHQFSYPCRVIVQGLSAVFRT